MLSSPKESNSKKRIYITLDTEMDADIHWKKEGVPQFTSVLEGIPNILRPIWDKYDVHPIYFVSPEVARSAACCQVLKAEVAKGAVIGAHLHPEYIEPFQHEKKEEAEFPCYAYTKEIEKEKLENLTDLIERNIGIRPVWYRAARYGADLDTIHILQELGYQYDSSVTPGISWKKKKGPDHSKAPLHEYIVSDTDLYRPAASEHKTGITGTGICEYPITITGKRCGIIGKFLPDNWLFYNWLRPTHMTYLEQKYLLYKMKHQNNNKLVMMFHSMEIMINKTPFVRTKWMQTYFLWRLEKTLAYARKKGYEV